MAILRMTKRHAFAAFLIWLVLLPGSAIRAGQIPHPELEGLEPAVAEQIRELQTALEEAQGEDPPVQAVRYAELGALYHSLKFTEAALACYRYAESLTPGDGRWPYLQGVLHTDTGNLPAARRALLRALALQSDLSTGWIRLGNLALDEGDPQDALLHFRRALAKLPDSAAARAGTGRTLLELGRAREAIEQLEKALELEPRASRLHYPLAMAYRALDNQEKMRAHLDEVGSIGVAADDPIAEYVDRHAAGARVHIQQGNKAYRAGDYAKAVEYFTQAVKAAPGKASAWTNLGAAQGALDNMAEARRSFEQALKITPGNITALENLVAVLVSEGDESAALPLLNEHLPSDSEHRNLLFRRAELRRLNGDPDGAIRDFERLTELYPSTASAWMGLIISHVEAGEHDEVQALLVDADEALGEASSLERELVDALAAVRGGDKATAELVQRLAMDLYEQNPGAEGATRVARSFLMEPDGCEASTQWLSEQINSASVEETLRGDLEKIQTELQKLDRCSAKR